MLWADDDRRYFHGRDQPDPGGGGIPLCVLPGPPAGCGGRTGAVPEKGKKYGTVLCHCRKHLADQGYCDVLLWVRAPGAGAERRDYGRTEVGAVYPQRGKSGK